MEMTAITAFVTLLTALSLAAERLVEIVKGPFPSLSKQLEEGSPAETWRRMKLHILAIFAGIFTAWLCTFLTMGKTAKGEVIYLLPHDYPVNWVILGIMASGGSGFWNSIQEYLNKLKDIKKAEAKDMKAIADAREKVANGTDPAAALVRPARS